jgi:hypothetical protein
MRQGGTVIFTGDTDGSALKILNFLLSTAKPTHSQPRANVHCMNSGAVRLTPEYLLDPAPVYRT